MDDTVRDDLVDAIAAAEGAGHSAGKSDGGEWLKKLSCDAFETKSLEDADALISDKLQEANFDFESDEMMSVKERVLKEVVMHRGHTKDKTW